MNRFRLTFLFQLIIIFVFAQKVNTSLTYSVFQAPPVKEKAPVLLLLHGYGSNENDLLEMAKKFDSRFLIFSLRAPHATSSGGYSWYDVEFLPNNELKYEYKQVAESREKISQFISNACKAFNADSMQVFVLGFSQGTIMAYDLSVAIPAKIKGLVALSGRMLPESQAPSQDWQKVRDVKIFIAHGSSDNVIRIIDSENANTFFKEKKVSDLTFQKYDMPHAIKGVEINDISAWLTSRLNPIKSGK